jgi:threonine dehydrogenase-like Zn-dependent dehydrogenase
VSGQCYEDHHQKLETLLLATMLYGPGDVRVEGLPDPRIEEPADVIVQVRMSAICGSDLGGYQGVDPVTPGQRMCHESLSEVTDVGDEVETIRKEDQVVAPLRWSDGTGRFCLDGLPTSCLHGGDWGTRGTDAGQGEAVRVPWADATLVHLPRDVATGYAAMADRTAIKVLISLTAGGGGTIDGVVGVDTVPRRALLKNRLGVEEKTKAIVSQSVTRKRFGAGLPLCHCPFL